MKVRGRTLIGIVALGGLVTIGFLTAKNMMKVRKLLSTKDAFKALDYLPEAALRIKNFHRTTTTDGRKEWELWGEEAQFLKDRREAVIVAPKIALYPKGREAISFRAKEGRAFFQDEEVRRIELGGGLAVEHRGFQINMDKATYDPKSRTIVSHGPVVMKGDRIEVRGDSLSLSLDEGKMTLGRGVKAMMTPTRNRRG